MKNKRTEKVRIILNEDKNMEHVADRLLCRYVHQLIAK